MFVDINTRVKISNMLNTKCVYVRSGVKIMLGLVLKVLKVIVSLLPFCRPAPYVYEVLL
jgi:hypothetical protein